MSDNQERSSSAIQVEYNRLCSRLGHLHYTVNTLSAEIELLNQALRDLNQEHGKAKEREKASEQQAEKKEENS